MADKSAATRKSIADIIERERRELAKLGLVLLPSGEVVRSDDPRAQRRVS
jgi:hypothetical protein